MMFNGLVMCTDSDSDYKDSICRSSEVESPGSSCGFARAQYYHNKLLATLEVLHNKEETVKVQTESLAMAEARIATLTERSADLKREIERRRLEMNRLREKMQQGKGSKKSADVSSSVNEVEHQKIVSVLQNNLSVIEDLYRECFYETAKQESLIDMLRKSYLDVRLMDKEKSDQISRLHNVINTQKWSLDKFQDITSDVDNLKVEISNFLNNSNNDSGVWEQSVAGDASEDLQDIASGLLRLRELLVSGCTCGLEEENRRLRLRNERLEAVAQRLLSLKELIPGTGVLDDEKRIQINERPMDFGGLLLKKLKEIAPGKSGGKSTVDFDEETQTQKGSSEMEDFEELVLKLSEIMNAFRDFKQENSRLQEINVGLEERLEQLNQNVADLENKVDNKDGVFKELRVVIETKEDEIKSLQEQLSTVADQLDACEKVKIKLQQAQDLLQDKCSELAECLARCAEKDKTIAALEAKVAQCDDISKEYCALRESTCSAQRLVRELRQHQAMALQHCAQKMDLCHRDKISTLCAESRRAVRCVRAWTQRRTDLHKEQENIIKQKDSQIKLLREQLEREQNNTRESKRVTEIDNCCTQCDELNSSTFVKRSCDRNRRDASCSGQPTTLSFVSPKVRLIGNIPACSPTKHKGFSSKNKIHVSTCEASVQEPVCCDASANSSTVKLSNSKLKMADQPYCTHKMADLPSCSKHKSVTQEHKIHKPSCSDRTAISFASPRRNLLGNFPIYPPAAKLFLKGLLSDKTKCEAGMQNPIRCNASASSSGLEQAAPDHNVSFGAGADSPSKIEDSLLNTFLNENKFYTEQRDAVTCFSDPEEVTTLTYHRQRGKCGCKTRASEMHSSTPRSARPLESPVSPPMILRGKRTKKLFAESTCTKSLQNPERCEAAGSSSGLEKRNTNVGFVPARTIPVCTPEKQEPIMINTPRDKKYPTSPVVGPSSSDDRLSGSDHQTILSFDTTRAKLPRSAVVHEETFLKEAQTPTKCDMDSFSDGDQTCSRTKVNFVRSRNERGLGESRRRKTKKHTHTCEASAQSPDPCYSSLEEPSSSLRPSTLAFPSSDSILDAPYPTAKELALMSRILGGDEGGEYCNSMKEVLARVESAGAALRCSLQRWNRHVTARRPRGRDY